MSFRKAFFSKKKRIEYLKKRSIEVFKRIEENRNQNSNPYQFLSFEKNFNKAINGDKKYGKIWDIYVIFKEAFNTSPDILHLIEKYEQWKEKQKGASKYVI